MLHEPAAAATEDRAEGFKTKLGIRMFVWYCLFYASFVVVNLGWPQAMEAEVAFGLNLATVFGFALIVVALVQALVYDWMCRVREAQMADETSEGAAR
ncbi:MAG: DUF485 domain-containing protein [Armatimonadetes bacterium]|nr:DUF485 domain-containing protein [Armatimonadota bacterium]